MTIHLLWYIYSRKTASDSYVLVDIIYMHTQGDRRQATAQLPSGGAVATPQVHVTLEDQQNINTFSRLNSQLQELRSKLAAKKRAVEDFEEAGNEAMLVDDDVVPFVVGECFVRLPQEDVESKIEECAGIVC